jgi:hypothetical protein
MTRKFTQDRYCIDFKSPEGVIELKNELLERYPDAKNFSVESATDEWGDGHSAYLRYERLETDKEYAHRVAQDEYVRLWRAEHERRQYEELKKKFGGQ